MTVKTASATACSSGNRKEPARSFTTMATSIWWLENVLGVAQTNFGHAQGYGALLVGGDWMLADASSPQ